MAISITVRNIPNEVRDELASRAAGSGRSVQEYLRAELIELARRPDPAVLLAEIRRRKQETASRLLSATILEHREADRR